MLVVLVKGIDHSSFVHVAHHIHRRKVHVFDGLHDIWQFFLCDLKDLEDISEVAAGDDSHITALRLNWAQQCALSNDAL